MTDRGLKKNWSITSESFRRLLVWLDDGVDSDGERFLEMRRRLVDYFDRKNCLNADELADETLNRVARRIEEEDGIEVETPAKFCYITARFVFMESLRDKGRGHMQLDALGPADDPRARSAAVDDERERREKLLDCLDRCTAKLEAVNRDLIVRYYEGEERVKIDNRRTLAAELGISVNALSIRACRLRDKLENCVGNCAGT